MGETSATSNKNNSKALLTHDPHIFIYSKSSSHTPAHTQSTAHTRTHNNIRHTNNLPATQVTPLGAGGKVQTLKTYT